MTDLPALVTAGVAALGTIGGGARWLWLRIERRFDAVEKKLAECERREVRHQKTASVHLTVIELLWLEVKRRSRGAPNDTLERAGKLLDELKNKDPER